MGDNDKLAAVNEGNSRREREDIERQSDNENETGADEAGLRAEQNRLNVRLQSSCGVGSASGSV